MSAKPAIEEVDGHPPVLSFLRNLLSNYEDHFTSSLLVAYLAARQARIISAAAETTEEDESQVELLCINIIFVFWGIAVLRAIQAQEVSKMDPQMATT